MVPLLRALNPTCQPMIDGNQLEPDGRSGFNWTSEPTYSFTADASGEDDNDVLIATAVNTGSPGSSAIQWSYR